MEQEFEAQLSAEEVRMLWSAVMQGQPPIPRTPTSSGTTGLLYTPANADRFATAAWAYIQARDALIAHGFKAADKHTHVNVALGGDGRMRLSWRA